MAKKKIISASFIGEQVTLESTDQAREFYNQSRFGTLLDDGRVLLSLLEGFYLLQNY